MPWEAVGLLLGLGCAAALLLTKVGKILWTGVFVLLGGYSLWVYGANLSGSGSEPDATPLLWWFQTLALVGAVVSFGVAGVLVSNLALQIRLERIERELRRQQPHEPPTSTSAEGTDEAEG